VKERIVIIGAGPAGAAAAIQLKRSGFDPLVLEENQPGGTLREARLVENYPGFPEGIPGETLADLIVDHLSRLHVRLRITCVLKVIPLPSALIVETDDEHIETERLIVASGSKPCSWNGPSFPTNISGRIHSSIREIKELHGSKAAVIGGGDVAYDYALSLADRGWEVFIIRRSEDGRALSLLQKRVSGISSIHEVIGFNLITMEPQPDGIILSGSSPGEEKRMIRVDRILLATGREPNLAFLGQDESWARRRKDVRIIGDAANGIFRQTAIAAGDGVRTAMALIHEMDKRI